MWAVIKETPDIVSVVCYNLLPFQHQRRNPLWQWFEEGWRNQLWQWFEEGWRNQLWQWFEEGWRNRLWQWFEEGCRKPVARVWVSAWHLAGKKLRSFVFLQVLENRSFLGVLTGFGKQIWHITLSHITSRNWHTTYCVTYMTRDLTDSPEGTYTPPVHPVFSVLTALPPH